MAHARLVLGQQKSTKKFLQESSNMAITHTPDATPAPPIASMFALQQRGDQPRPLNSAYDMRNEMKAGMRRTAAEEFAGASSNSERGLARSHSATSFQEEDIVAVNLREAIGMLDAKSSISCEVDRKPKKSWDLEHLCAQCWQQCKTKKNGCLKGIRKSIPRKQHIIQYWQTQLNNRVHKKKQAIIVDGNDELSVSYQELDEFSNSIAYSLKQLKFSDSSFENLNPNNELIIAVALPSCYEYVVILLAVLKLGAAFLPLSYDLPAERIAEIVKLTRPVLTIITEQEDNLYTQAYKLVEFDIIHLDDIWNLLSLGEGLKKSILPFKDPIQSLDKARPYPPMWKRTVAVTVVPSDSQEIQALTFDSKAFFNRIEWESHYFVFLGNECCLMQPNCDTLEFVADTLTQLCVGATIVALQSPIDYYIPDMLFSYCQQYKIRRLTLFPALLKACTVSLQLFESYAQSLATVRYWFCVGGFMSLELAEMFFEMAPAIAQLVHMYHHEDCLGALTFEIYESAYSAFCKNFFARVPVGTPAPNVDIYILDEHQNLVKDGELGEIYVTGMQLPLIKCAELQSNQYYLKNPFSSDKNREFMIRTLDFGRISTKSNGNRTLIHEHTRARHCYVENQIVWLLHIDMYLARLTNLVKKFYTMCYRPNEDDQLIVAFCVFASKDVTWEKVEDELCDCVPLSMIPEVVAIDAIPYHVKSKLPDENELLKYYQEQRATRLIYDGWNKISFPDDKHLRAAKILFYLIFTYIGTPIKELVEKHWDRPFLSIKRATVTKGAFIVRELHKNRYPMYMDNFIYSTTLENIVQDMVQARHERGFVSNQGCPPDEISFMKNRYRLEIMVNSTRSSVCTLLAKCFTARGQLDYYAAVSFQAMRKFFDACWPVFASKKLSIVVRNKKGKNKLVGAVLNMNWRDELQLTNTNIPPNIGYKLELIEYLESGITDAQFKQEDTHVLQICYLGLDATALTPFEIHGLTDKLIRSILIIGKVKLFDVVVIVTYDYFTWEICVHNYNFKRAQDCQVNQFVASDGTRPYALCPDSMVATILWKSLSKIQDVAKNSGRHYTLPTILTLAQAQPKSKKPWND